MQVAVLERCRAFPPNGRSPRDSLKEIPFRKERRLA